MAYGTRQQQVRAYRGQTKKTVSPPLVGLKWGSAITPSGALPRERSIARAISTGHPRASSSRHSSIDETGPWAKRRSGSASASRPGGSTGGQWLASPSYGQAVSGGPPQPLHDAARALGAKRPSGYRWDTFPRSAARARAGEFGSRTQHARHESRRTLACLKAHASVARRSRSGNRVRRTSCAGGGWA